MRGRRSRTCPALSRLSLRARFGARSPIETRRNEHANCRAVAVKRRSFFPPNGCHLFEGTSIWWLSLSLDVYVHILLSLYYTANMRARGRAYTGARYLILEPFNGSPRLRRRTTRRFEMQQQTRMRQTNSRERQLILE